MPIICRQGIWGWAACRSPETPRAAWPPSWMARTTAKPTRRSRSGSKGDLGGLDDALAEEMTEAGRRVQVDLAPEELAELALQVDELKQADTGVGGELDKHVDVALGAEVVAQHGSEEG